MVKTRIKHPMPGKMMQALDGPREGNARFRFGLKNGKEFSCSHIEADQSGEWVTLKDTKDKGNPNETGRDVDVLLTEIAMVGDD